MGYNAELGDRVLAQIRDHPETWEQTMWRCRTGMCFAGWTVDLMPGYTWRNEVDDGLSDSKGNRVYVWAVARDLLDLDDERADLLFKGDNDLDRLERLHKHFSNNPDDDSLPEDV